MTKSQKFLRKVLGPIVLLLITVFFSKYIYEHFEEITTQLKKIDGIHIGLSFIFTIAAIYINGLVLKTLMKPFKIDLKEHFLLSAGASFLNLITPLKGGSGIRAIYMKKRYKLSYPNFIASLLGSHVIIFLVSSSIALITFLLAYLNLNIFNPIITLIYLGFFLTSMTFIFVPMNLKGNSTFIKRLQSLIKGWNIIRKNHKIIFNLILFFAINILIEASFIKFTFGSLSIEIQYVQAFYIAILNSLAIFISITPGALGIRESLYFIGAHLVNIAPETTLIVAIIIRAIEASTLLVLGPIANFKLFGKIKEELKTS